MRNGTLLLFFFCCLATASAQQPVQRSLHMFNRLSYNPAYAGLDNSLSITALYRRQWVGLEGAPTTQQLHAHLPLLFFNSGIGFGAEVDELGLERNTRFFGAYNYQLQIGRKSLLSIGISGGILQKSLDGNAIRTPDGNYGGDLPDHRDGILSTTNEIGQTPSFGVGIYYFNPKLELGLSAKDISEQTLSGDLIGIQQVRNYFFSTSAHLDMGRSLRFHPSLYVKSDLRQTQLDFSALISFNDNILMGGSFRGYNMETVDAAAAIVGWQLNEHLQIVYSYDFTLSDLATVSTGSHEILINYNLNKSIGKAVPPRVIYNPRFLDRN